MKDYENIFIYAHLGNTIRWDELEPYIVFGYAALFFQQVAQHRHDYQKEPLFYFKKTGFGKNLPKNSIIKAIDSYYLIASDYFMDLINQNSFFEKLHHNQMLYNTLLYDGVSEFKIENIHSVTEAYRLLREMFNHQVYWEEIEHICELAKPYCAVLDEKEKFSNNIKELNHYSNHKNKI